MRIAIGADHAGFAAEGAPRRDARAASVTQVDDHGTDSEAPVDYPPICAERRARGRRRRAPTAASSSAAAGRASRSPPTRSRGPRRALQRSLHRAAVARAQRRQRPRHGRHASSRFGLADEIVALWLATAVRRRTPSAARSIRSPRSNAAARTGQRRSLTRPAGPPVHGYEDRHPLPLAHAGRHRPRDRRRDRRTSCTARTAASS